MVYKSGAEIIHPIEQETYEMEDVKIQVLSANLNEEENNQSIVLEISFYNTSIIVTGDAESSIEEELINENNNLNADVLIAGHHGSNTSNSIEFLQAVKPSHVMISCGLGNAYLHPAKETLKNIKAVNANLYRTDLQDEIILYTDGNNISFSDKPCDDWSSGEELLNSKQEEIEQDKENKKNSRYVVNTNSKKIHKANCDSVKDMEEHNKMYTDESIETLISMGYEPCQNCNPE